MKVRHLSVIAAFLLLILAMASVPSYGQARTCPISPLDVNRPTCRQPAVQRIESPDSLYNRIQYNNRISLMRNAFDLSGLMGTFRVEGPFTLFVPVNDAFNRLPAQTVSNMFLTRNREGLRTMALNHIVQGERLTRAQLQETNCLVMTSCLPLTVRTANGGDIYIGNARILGSEEVADNGIIYYIDSLLIPGCSDITAMESVYMNGYYDVSRYYYIQTPVRIQTPVYP